MGGGCSSHCATPFFYRTTTLKKLLSFKASCTGVAVWRPVQQLHRTPPTAISLTFSWSLVCTCDVNASASKWSAVWFLHHQWEKPPPNAHASMVFLELVFTSLWICVACKLRMRLHLRPRVKQALSFTANLKSVNYKITCNSCWAMAFITRERRSWFPC